MPGSLEAYYQGSGRAGRDHGPATCTLLYDLRDRRLQQFFLARRYPSVEELGRVHAALVSHTEEEREIDFAQLHSSAQPISMNKTRGALALFQDPRIVQARPGREYELIRRVVDAPEFEQQLQRYRSRSDQDQDKLERMVFYAQTGLCRRKVMLEYFKEAAPWDECGTCDNCLRPPPEPVQPRAREETGRTEQHVPAIKPGDAVHLQKFGMGRVTAVRADTVSIVFPDGESRTFLREYVRPGHSEDAT
jgi:ATP-dependent DNA helicase RecQ